MAKILTIEQRKERIVRWSKLGWVGLVLVAGFAVAPVIYSAVSGLLGLAVAVVVGSLVIAMANPFGRWVANLRMKAIKATARMSPLETIENSVIEKEEKIATYAQGLRNFEAGIKTLKVSYAQMWEKYPAREEELKNRLNARINKLNGSKEKLKGMKEALATEKEQLDEYRHMLHIAEEEAKMNQLEGSVQGSIEDSIVLKEAFEEIRRRDAAASVVFDDLDMDIMEMAKKAPALEDNASPQYVGEKVKVEARRV